MNLIIVQVFDSSGLLPAVIRLLISDYLKEHVTFVFITQQSKSLLLNTEDLNPQYQIFGNFKSYNIIYYYYYYYFWHGSPERAMSPRPRGFLITHNDTPQSVGLLWTGDQFVAETST
jgi:hypothetical protein